MSVSPLADPVPNGAEQVYASDLSQIGIQPKLKLGQPDDQYELEADRVADQVMRMSSSSADDGLGAQGRHDKQEETLQAKSMADGLKSDTPLLEHGVEAIQHGGSPLTGEERNFFEPRFGVGLDSVRIHTDGDAARASQAINAKAFTLNNHIAFNSGYYAPSSYEGRRLLAHELTHVIQQTGIRSGVGHGEGEVGTAGPAEGASISTGGSKDVVQRDIKADLRDAMSGWGTDEQRIYTLLRNASQPEKDLVRGDPVLMEELRGELTRVEWGYVLGYLNMPLETRIHAAASGWGTDEANIYSAVRYASLPNLRSLMLNGPLLTELRDELSDSELGIVMGTVADKLTRWATAEEAYHALMLFPAAVNEACDIYEGPRGNNFQTDLVDQMYPGHTMAPQTISDVNNHIANDDNAQRVLASFRRRWNVAATATATGGAQVPAWTVERIRVLHSAVQQMPSSHIASANQNIQTLAIVAGLSHGGTWTESAGLLSLRVPEPESELRGTVRHEVGHAIDDRLGATSRNFKQSAPNFWDWDRSDVWERHMSNPWRRNSGAHSGSDVIAADQAQIKLKLNSYVTTTDGTQTLWDYAGAGDPIRTYWNDDVPMIEAAKSLAGLGVNIHWHPDRMKRYGNRYYSWNTYYNQFYSFGITVMEQRVSDSSLFGESDFFAELYMHYYAEGPGVERLRRLSRVPAWQTFFDTHVHPIA